MCKTTGKQFLGAAVASLIYLSWMYLKVGLRLDHVLSYIVVVFLFFYSTKTRRFFFAISPFIVFVTLYDSMRVFPNFLYNSVDIENVYRLEKTLFGVDYGGLRLTLNEFFAHHQHALFDAIAGLSYMSWVPVPLAFTLYLYFTGRKSMCIDMSLVFLLTNVIGFIVYYIHPTAPPWYVEQHGFDFLAGTTGVAARIGNFDRLIGLPIFETFYSGNVNVFAAIPSLHAAYPITCLLISFGLKKPLLSAFFLLNTIGIWFGAIYGNQHYLLDLIAGGLTALTAFFVVKVLLRKTPANNFMLWYEGII